jgi:hypothetical protein
VIALPFSPSENGASIGVRGEPMPRLAAIGMPANMCATSKWPSVRFVVSDDHAG